MEALRRTRAVWSVLALIAGGALAITTFQETRYYLTAVAVLAALLLTVPFYTDMKWFIRPPVFVIGLGLLMFTTTPMDSNSQNTFELLLIALTAAPVLLVAGWIVDALLPNP